MGVSNNFLLFLHDILRHNTVHVVNDGYLSSPILQRLDLPQGDKLSPLLFSLFIADLAEIFVQCKCFCIFYADDVVITSSSPFDIQLALYRLGIYCKNNNMNVNVGKTKFINFCRGGRLKSTDRICYMGVILGGYSDGHQQENRPLE